MSKNGVYLLVPKIRYYSIKIFLNKQDFLKIILVKIYVHLAQLLQLSCFSVS